ncbi:hypothetical protein P3G55_17450 [Leptospira sp. 96542]|nr:hypothetical protein [Leptospira sp. 96542]
MALKPCRECKKEVSTEAKTCPHCGTPNPTKKEPTLKEKVIGAAVLAVLVLVGLSMCGDGEKEKKPPPTDDPGQAAKKAQEDAACRADLQCIGNKLVIAAGIYCPDSIEKLAKNSAKWTDGTFEPKFSRFRWKDGKKQTVVMIGDKVQFQNGFGAYVNMVYECEFNVQTERPEMVNVSEGRLP